MIPILLVSVETKITRSFIDNYLRKNLVSKDRIFEVTPLKKEIVISQVKEVLKRMVFASDLPRFFIFHDFDTAASESQNALLKSLEDNSLKNQFILVVKNEHLIFPTIRSRARIIRLSNKESIPKDDRDLILLLSKVENSSNYHFLIESTLKSTDREKVVQIFDKLIVCYQKKLGSDPIAVVIMKKILNLRTLLLANNLSPQLAYDNLLIFISKAFRMKI